MFCHAFDDLCITSSRASVYQNITMKFNQHISLINNIKNKIIKRFSYTRMNYTILNTDFTGRESLKYEQSYEDRQPNTEYRCS